MTSGMPSTEQCTPSVSVLVPVKNGAEHLEGCLEALSRSETDPIEIIVIDDGSTDDTVAVGRRWGVRVLSLPTSRGPAFARNRGAEVATGDLLFFIDADVRVQVDTLTIGVGCFVADPGLAGVIGSYDDQPGHPSFLSQYKNLFHHWVHQTSREEAWTFWTGCGAIRRSVLLELGGFNEGYPRPSIEDIELGFRMRRAGHRIRLEKRMLARHMKEWRFFDLMRTDIFRRGAPWIALMLRDRFAMGDLNLSSESRYGTVLAYLFFLLIPATILFPGPLLPWALPIGLLLIGSIVWMHRPLYAFFLRKRGAAFAVGVLPMHLLFFLYSGVCIPIGMLSHWLDRRRAEKTASGPGVRSLAPLAITAEDRVPEGAQS